MKQQKVDFCIVLGHLMKQDGSLLKESRLRADKGYELYKKGMVNKLILSGWDYREDSKITLARAMREYLEKTHCLNKKIAYLCEDSRDTVGDAVFSRKKIEENSSSKNFCVVTSCYHEERARKIFEFVYGESFQIKFIGVGQRLTKKISKNEELSLRMFHKTFSDAKSGDLQSIYDILIDKHPLYNDEEFRIKLKIRSKNS